MHPCLPFLKNILIHNLYIYVASTEEELKKTRKERDDIRREKDEIIAELQFKIDHMESAYESVLHVSMFKGTVLLCESKNCEHFDLILTDQLCTDWSQ